MFSILKGGQVYPVPSFLPQWLPPVKYQVVSSSRYLLKIRVPALAVCLGMSKGLGWGEGFDWA